MTPNVRLSTRCPSARWAVFALLLPACTGSVSDGPARPGQTAGITPTESERPGSTLPESQAEAVVARCTTRAVAPSEMRRLTHEQYDNAVRDLLGDTSRPARDFAKGTEHGLFDTMADPNVAPLLADQYLDAAVALAEGVRDVKALMGCDPASSTGANCTREWTKRFARRAFRRPLTSQEQTDLTALYDTTRASSDALTGVRAVIAAIFASPNFLFMPELGGDAASLPNATKSSPYELAARLAWLLWSSVPDDVLLDAAANGELSTPEQVASQARRLLADARARSATDAFFAQWFGLSMLDSASKDPSVYPSFDDGLRGAMREETRRFVQHVIWEGDAKLSTLLTAPYSFVNGALAKLYGVSAPSDAASFVKTNLDASQRSGILTQASVLTAFASSNASSPVKRGKWLRTRMLCHELPEPPANIPPLPPPAQGTSTRERFAQHTASPACSGCHSLIDGLGFGLERFDGIGAARSSDLGVPVDSSGQINQTLDIDGPYDGAAQLAGRLAQSEQVEACAPTQWFRHAMGRHESAEDACSLEALQRAFKSSGGNLQELMVAVTQTDAFLHYRQPQ